jgi:hypothetical protein
MQSFRPQPIPQISPGDNVESGIAFIEPSNVILSDEVPCLDDYFNAAEDQIFYYHRLDHDAVEMFDSFPAVISLNVQTMPQILEDQQVL